MQSYGKLNFRLDQTNQTWKLPDAAPYVKNQIERDKKFLIKFCACLFAAAVGASVLFWSALPHQKQADHYDRIGMLILMDQASR